MGLWIGGWFSFVILVFKPFGIRFEYTDMFFILLVLSYSMLASGIFLFNEFILKDIVRNNAPGIRWTRRAVYIWYGFQLTSMLLLCAAFFWLIITPIYQIAALQITLLALKITFLVMVPIIISGTYFINNRSERVELIVFKSLDKSTDFSIPSSSLLYVKSEDNYISVCYLGADSVPASKLIRSTLKIQEKHLTAKGISKCHRSFMINTKHISYITGNKKNLKIKLQDVPTFIPVSRSFVDHFYDLKENHSPQI